MWDARFFPGRGYPLGMFLLQVPMRLEDFDCKQLFGLYPTQNGLSKRNLLSPYASKPCPQTCHRSRPVVNFPVPQFPRTVTSPSSNSVVSFEQQSSRTFFAGSMASGLPYVIVSNPRDPLDWLGHGTTHPGTNIDRLSVIRPVVRNRRSSTGLHIRVRPVNWLSVGPTCVSGDCICKPFEDV